VSGPLPSGAPGRRKRPRAPINASESAALRLPHHTLSFTHFGDVVGLLLRAGYDLRGGITPALALDPSLSAADAAVRGKIAAVLGHPPSFSRAAPIDMKEAYKVMISNRVIGGVLAPRLPPGSAVVTAAAGEARMMEYYAAMRSSRDQRPSSGPGSAVGGGSAGSNHDDTSGRWRSSNGEPGEMTPLAAAAVARAALGDAWVDTGTTDAGSRVSATAVAPTTSAAAAASAVAAAADARLVRQQLLFPAGTTGDSSLRLELEAKPTAAGPGRVTWREDFPAAAAAAAAATAVAGMDHTASSSIVASAASGGAGTAASAAAAFAAGSESEPQAKRMRVEGGPTAGTAPAIADESGASAALPPSSQAPTSNDDAAPDGLPRTVPLTLTAVLWRNAVFVKGRYCKFSRSLSQTPWLVEGSTRVDAGCSVEELIGNVVARLYKEPWVLPGGAAGDATPTDVSSLSPSQQPPRFQFHAAGREDVDVRMLGDGRPFVLQLLDARPALAPLWLYPALACAVNAASQEILAVSDLMPATRVRMRKCAVWCCCARVVPGNATVG
jgi:hypothetical protein